MIYSVIAISLAFLWLLYETNFLSIRLPYNKPRHFNIETLIKTVIAVIVGFALTYIETPRDKWYMRYRLVRLLRRINQIKENR